MESSQKTLNDEDSPCRQLFCSKKLILTEICVHLQKKTEYFSDWEKGISGVIKGDNKDARNDFALRMLCFVEVGNSTGYLCAVKREHDGLIKYVSCTPF